MLHLTVPAGIDLAEARRREQQAREYSLRPVRRQRAGRPFGRLVAWAAVRVPKPGFRSEGQGAEKRTVIPFPQPSHAER